MSKKVLIELQKLSNLNSGLGQFCLGLAQALEKNKSTTVSLNYLIPENAQQVFTSGEKCITLKSHFSFMMNPPKGYDVWHCAHQQSKYLPKKGKLILTVHDLNFLYKYSGIKRKWKLYQLQKKVDTAHAVIAISQFTANEIKSNLKIDTKKLHVIYNGVAVSDDKDTQLPEAIQHKKYIFNIGIVSPKKNLHVLLPLLAQNPDLNLVIAGNSRHAYAKELQEKAHKMGLLNRLHLLGEVSESTKYALYKSSQAFVFPSLTEGFGMPVIEAMHFGKPVFLSNATCLPEIGGKEAFYWHNFEENNMQEVFEKGMQEFERDSLKQERIRQHAAQFTWDKAAKAYLNLYENV